jgi:hypothetical protein
MEHCNIFNLEYFPDELTVHGDSKFKTPRSYNEKVPIIILPQCIVNCVSTFRHKKYLEIFFGIHEMHKFEKITNWIRSQSCKPLYEFLNESNNKIKMKIRLPEHFSFIDDNGSEVEKINFSSGSIIRCAVEIPCLWENENNIGLSFQMVQCKVVKEAINEEAINKETSCMIQNFD